MTHKTTLNEIIVGVKFLVYNGPLLGAPDEKIKLLLENIKSLLQEYTKEKGENINQYLDTPVPPEVAEAYKPIITYIATDLAPAYQTLQYGLGGEFLGRPIKIIL